MSKHLLATMSMVLILSACATVRDSRINPFNWFGRDTSEAVTVDPDGAVVDGRRLAAQIVSLKIDSFPGGAIIRTVGLPPTQGFWEAELVEIETDNPSEVVYEFRVLPPVAPRRQGTQRSREIIAGATLTRIRLETVRSITVVGASNKRTVRR
jgi:hypothetical protein